LEIAPLGVRFLPYPVTAISGAASPELIRRYGAVPLVRDGDGNFHLTFDPPRLFRIEVLSAAKAAVDLVPPSDLDPSREVMGSETLRAFGRDAAEGVDPAASPFLFASRIADHLSSRFFYSVDSAPWASNPVEEFLTRRKSGHCETFATAMALVLREHGIPSRLVTGFAGGERGLFGSYYLVRGLDAHAWVEAWCGPGYGWITFDPTPPAGRPGVTKVSVLRSTGQLFENLEFLYGRYVLGFAQADQASLAQTVREGAEAAAETAKSVARALRAFVRGGFRHRLSWLLLVGAAALVVATLLMRRLSRASGGFGTRGLPPASAAYRTLQRVLRRRGADLTPASAPSETLASADRLGAGRISQEIVGAYVAESFGGRPTPEAEAARLGSLLKELRTHRPSS
jgi:transglutaminase-like putative cysteine protease